MIDFLMISTRSTKRGVIEIYPKFIIMVGPFYANLNNTASNSNSNNGAALSYP